jgi:nucleoside-diphosphate-sugar epimerase
LAARLGAKHLNYMSTAYVCGARSGRILEEAAPEDVPVNNQYERSKVAAESFVARDNRFGRRIMRPSIVIGHSKTLKATNFTGLYGFLRKLHAFRGMMDRAQTGLLDRKSVRLRLDADCTLDFVPIDRVTANAVTIATTTCPAKHEVQYYHLSNPLAPPISPTIAVVAQAAGLSSMTFVNNRNDFDWLDEKFNSRIDFYNSYFLAAKTFDRSRLERIVGDEPHEAYDMPPERIRDYCDWYVHQLKEARADLPETR